VPGGVAAGATDDQGSPHLPEAPRRPGQVFPPDARL
jgi:hypothetical protein